MVWRDFHLSTLRNECSAYTLGMAMSAPKWQGYCLAGLIVLIPPEDALLSKINTARGRLEGGSCKALMMRRPTNGE